MSSSTKLPLEPPAKTNVKSLFPKNRSHLMQKEHKVRAEFVEPLSSEAANKYLYLERELIYRTAKTAEAMQELEARISALEVNQRQILDVLKMLATRTEGK